MGDPRTQVNTGRVGRVIPYPAQDDEGGVYASRGARRLPTLMIGTTTNAQSIGNVTFTPRVPSIIGDRINIGVFDLPSNTRLTLHFPDGSDMPIIAGSSMATQVLTLNRNQLGSPGSEYTITAQVGDDIMDIKFRVPGSVAVASVATVDRAPQGRPVRRPVVRPPVAPVRTGGFDVGD